MVEYVGHGGSCCGMAHLRGFTQSPTQDGVNELVPRSAIERGRVDGILKEVVLTHAQLRNRGRVIFQEEDQDLTWAQILEAKGYKLVSIFQNSNSGNTCFVFHLHNTRLTPDNMDYGFDETTLQSLKNMFVEVPQVVEQVPVERVAERIPAETQALLDEVDGLRNLAVRVSNSRRLPQGGIAKELANSLLRILDDG